MLIFTFDFMVFFLYFLPFSGFIFFSDYFSHLFGDPCKSSWGVTEWGQGRKTPHGGIGDEDEEKMR